MTTVLCMKITSNTFNLLKNHFVKRKVKRTMSSFNSHQEKDHDFESITRIFGTASLLQCPLCKKEIRDPRILCSNGHTFCHDCIKVFPQTESITVYLQSLFIFRMLYLMMVFLNVLHVMRHVV